MGFFCGWLGHRKPRRGAPESAGMRCKEQMDVKQNQMMIMSSGEFPLK